MFSATNETDSFYFSISVVNLNDEKQTAGLEISNILNNLGKLFIL